MSLTDRQCAHTKRMGELIIYAISAGLSVKVVEWNRLLATQKEYVDKGVSKTLDSAHLVNCATDLYIVLNGQVLYVTNDSPEEHKRMYRLLGTYWESRGGRWGGRFGLEKNPAAIQAGALGWDCPHFETPNV